MSNKENKPASAPTKKRKKTAPSNVEDNLIKPQMLSNQPAPEDSPEATEGSEEDRADKPFEFYVAYHWASMTGRKSEFKWTSIRSSWQEIDTMEKMAAVIQYLTDKNPGHVTIINIMPMEG